MATTVTIFGAAAETKETIMPESIEVDDLTGKTYINLQPVTDEPGWRPLDTMSHLPTTFTPMHQIPMPECPKFLFHIDGIDHSCADTLRSQQHSFPNTQEQLLPSGSKRARDEGAASSAASRGMHLMELLQRMSLLQQHQQLVNAFPADPVPPKTSRPTARMPLHHPPPASPVPQQTADAATDARELM